LGLERNFPFYKRGKGEGGACKGALQSRGRRGEGGGGGWAVKLREIGDIWWACNMGVNLISSC